ncbi:hypothetical protein SUGI_1027880 [Cryptomeria japonica]|nr:hypothetical protein SUGI_1027880 [Cryptomeria japonica]
MVRGSGWSDSRVSTMATEDSGDGIKARVAIGPIWGAIAASPFGLVAFLPWGYIYWSVWSPIPTQFQESEWCFLFSLIICRHFDAVSAMTPYTSSKRKRSYGCNDKILDLMVKQVSSVLAYKAIWGSSSMSSELDYSGGTIVEN